MPCPHCGSEWPANAAYCPKCGRPTGVPDAANCRNKPARTNRGRNIALIVLVIALLPVALIFGPPIAAAVLAFGLPLLFIVPVLVGTFAIVLGAIALAMLVVVGAFVAAIVGGTSGNLSITTADSKTLAKGTFERTLRVSDPIDLAVKTGAGSIEIRTGDDAAVRVVGTVRINGSSMTEAQAQEKLARIVAAPPVEQDGNTIRIGTVANDTLRGNVSISYVLSVPATTRVQAQTGAGSIRAVGLAGKFSAETGAGNIELLRASGAEIDVRTSAGNIMLGGAKLALFARTSAGNIEVEGTPMAGWRVQTSSGNITLRLPTNAAFKLKADTSAGSITTAHGVMTGGAIIKRNSLNSVVNGGGPLVEVSTSAGSIRVS